MNPSFLIKVTAKDTKGVTHTAFLCKNGKFFWFEKARKDSPQWAGARLTAKVKGEALKAAKRWGLENRYDKIELERDFF